MSVERENLDGNLKVAEYDIAGNPVRAYADANGRLVFVLDLLVDDIKPNVLLVINPDDNRKWDDILSNDWGVDLEDVRPKKDNKYQKLDIEYTGLEKYERLIQEYLAGDDTTNAVADLRDFRVGVAQRVATERLGAAEKLAAQARDTIDKTGETIATLQEKLKVWRAKLAEYKGQIGRAPGKQIASKILRAESQIDAISEKIVRAKKRLSSAKNRLVGAEDDAEVAREILERIQQSAGKNLVIKTGMEFNTSETGTEKMADNDIKPILDKDPNILNEEIAFKPIVFDAPKEPAVADVSPEVPATGDDGLVFQPIMPNGWENQELADVPMVEDVQVLAPVVEHMPAPVVEHMPAPVVEQIPVPVIDDELLPVLEEDKPIVPVVEQKPAPVLDALTPVVPQLAQEDNGFELPSERMSADLPVSPVEPAPTLAPVLSSAPAAPMPEISQSPIDGPGRPVSPITGGDVAVVTPAPRKPNVIYYTLLLVLIVLSIFTLWIYQKSTNKNLPELGATVQVETTEKSVAKNEQASDEPSPFIVAETEQPKVEAKKVETEPAPVKVEEPVVVPQPTKVAIAEVEPETVPATPAEVVTIASGVDIVDVLPSPAMPVVEETPVQSEPEVVEAAADEDTEEVEETSPFLTDEVVEKPKSKSVAEIIASKPVYNVARDDKAFVADPEFETDAVEEEFVDADEELEETVVEDDSADSVAGDSAIEMAVVAEPTGVEEVEQNLCEDGSVPGEDGCCAGEELVDLGDGELACCVEGTEQCFPPMK